MKTISISLDAAGSRFVAEGSHRGQLIDINAPKPDDDASRRPTGFSASELLLASAGACTAWDVLEMMRKRRHDLITLEVAVDGVQDEAAPWPYRQITLHFRLQGSGLRPKVVERVIRLACVRYCAVLATVRGVAEVSATMELVDGDGLSSGRLPVSLGEGEEATAEG
jgi:putative redox protein